MLFVIIADDVENSLELRIKHSGSHRARLQELMQQNRLVVAGPCPKTDSTDGFTGSVIIADFESLEAAKHFAATDPFVVNHVYKQVTVKPFKQVMPN